MPCSSNGYESYNTDPAVKKELDEVTAHLYNCCKSLECNGLPVPPEVAEWWFEHQKIDAARLAKEAKAEAEAKIKAGALDKLTEEEKRALGIHFRV